MKGPVDSTPLIRLESVSRSFGAIKAVDGVSLSVHPGEVLGLCGHNGAGKSTVVKMITGLIQPDDGWIEVGGNGTPIGSPQEAQRRGIALVDQELSVIPNLSVGDNILLGGLDEPFINRPRIARERVRALLDLVGLTDISPADITSDLSMGQRQLVEIARALGRDARVLVLDEPTATLGSNEIERVFTAVRQVVDAGCGVIYVSHRLDEVLDLCDRVTVLRDGKLVESTEAAGLDVDRLISLMLGDLSSAPEPVLALAGRETEIEVEISGLDVDHRITDFSLEIRRGHVYALAGQVGSGATEILRALAGLEPSARGSVQIAGRKGRLGSAPAAASAGIAYLSNDRKGNGLFLGLTARENLISTRLERLGWAGLLNPTVLSEVATRLAGAIGLAAKRLKEPALNFSGGNQQKIFIGRCLELAGTRLLLLDEPTRGVDVKGRMEIHALVRNVARQGTAVVFASTEIDEILDLADDIVTLRSGQIVGRHHRSEVDAEVLIAEMTHGRKVGVLA